MKTANFLASSCRYCRYYQSEGRRGGMCQQLGVPVQGQWKSCSLATHPFSATWDNLEDVVKLENSLNLSCSTASNSSVVKKPTIAETKQEATV